MLADAGFPRAAGAPTALPTPRANDAEKRGNFDPTNPRNGLPAAVKLLPTPRAGETSDRTSTPGNRFSLSAWASRGCSTLPTPTTRDHKGKQSPGHKERGYGTLLPDALIPTGEATYLNPSFVEEMMGFPVGWTV
jgi:DNA (cytosine-5)-methyltransferase 1